MLNYLIFLYEFEDYSAYMDQVREVVGLSDELRFFFLLVRERL